MCRKLKTKSRTSRSNVDSVPISSLYIYQHEVFSFNIWFRECASCHHTFCSDFCQTWDKADSHIYSHILVFWRSSHGVLKGHCFQEVIQLGLCVPAPYSASQGRKPAPSASSASPFVQGTYFLSVSEEAKQSTIVIFKKNSEHWLLYHTFLLCFLSPHWPAPNTPSHCGHWRGPKSTWNVPHESFKCFLLLWHVSGHHTKLNITVF